MCGAVEKPGVEYCLAAHACVFVCAAYLVGCGVQYAVDVIDKGGEKRESEIRKFEMKRKYIQ